jgi:hypothetical protein
MLEDNPTPPPEDSFITNSLEAEEANPDVVRRIHEELDRLESIVGGPPNGASRLGALELDKSDLGVSVVDTSVELPMSVMLWDEHSEPRSLRMIRASVMFFPPWEEGYDIEFEIHPDKVERSHPEHLDLHQAAQVESDDVQEKLSGYIKSLEANDESARLLREITGMDKEGQGTTTSVLQFVMRLHDLAKLALK